MNTRKEKDTMGLVSVPKEAYYGAQTQRALENFHISGLTLPSTFIKALGMIKKYSARVNLELKLLDDERAEAIIQAAEEVTLGKLDHQFVVDVFQTGSGTSTNMNANEVIAGRANEILTGNRGGKSPVHPNDHVNLGQSSNDVIPSAIHIAALTSIRDSLVPALQSNWLTAHVITCFLGYAAFAVAFSLSLLYLLKSRGGEGATGFLQTRLPPADLLDDYSYRIIAVGFPMLTLGIITGAAWANEAWGTYWSWDPKETWSLIVWLIYAAYLHARLARGWQG